MKKIVTVIVIVICIICAYALGYSNGMEKVSKHFSENTNDTEIKETEQDKKIKEFEEERYTLSENIIIDINDFKDIKYVVPDNISNTKLIVKNDGSICKFNLEKKFSNESNVLKLNSKIDKEIAVGIADDDCEIYWFVLKDYTVLKLDTINDKLTKEKGLSDFIMFNAPNVVKAIKKIKYNEITSDGTGFNLYVLKNNTIYNFDYDGVASDGKNTFTEKNKEGEIPSDEQVLLFTFNFIRTDKAVYKYCMLNEEDVNKYADVKEEYGYKKLEISKYLDDIVYIDEDCVVTSDGKVYV